MVQKPHIYADLDALSRAAASRWIALARHAIDDHGGFYVALSGGSTPRHLYELLASEDYAQQVDWGRVHIYFGDERRVPPDHMESNYRMANESLFQQVPIPPENIHRIQGEMADASESARLYCELLSSTVPASSSGMVQLDLVLLGMGDDGHVASLFPATPILLQRDILVEAVYVEKLSAWRISITFPVIDNAKHIMMLVAGETKAKVLQQVFGASQNQERLPVQMIQAQGEQEWFLDGGAAQLLPEIE